MEETVHDISLKMIQRKKIMTTSSKEVVERYFNIQKRKFLYVLLKIQIHHSFLEIRKGCLTRAIKKISKNCTLLIGRIITLILMMYTCWAMSVAFHNLHSSMTENLKYQILLFPYVGSYDGEKVNLLLNEIWILYLATSVELFVMM